MFAKDVVTTDSHALYRLRKGNVCVGGRERANKGRDEKGDMLMVDFMLSQ